MFYSVRRIVEQVDQLEADGLAFRNANGLLNLFGFWKTTKGNLIPEHMHEMVPPCILVLPTDELLAPRIEAARKRDYRALPFTDGTFKTYSVRMRLDWGRGGSVPATWSAACRSGSDSAVHPFGPDHAAVRRRERGTR